MTWGNGIRGSRLRLGAVNCKEDYLGAQKDQQSVSRRCIAYRNVGCARYTRDRQKVDDRQRMVQVVISFPGWGLSAPGSMAQCGQRALLALVAAEGGCWTESRSVRHNQSGPLGFPPLVFPPCPGWRTRAKSDIRRFIFACCSYALSALHGFTALQSSVSSVSVSALLFSRLRGWPLHLMLHVRAPPCSRVSNQCASTQR